MTTEEANAWQNSVGAPTITTAVPENEPAPITWADHVFDRTSRALRLCGHGAQMNWSVRLTNALWPYNNCSCCLLLRGVMLGLAIGATVGSAFAFAAISLWG